MPFCLVFLGLKNPVFAVVLNRYKKNVYAWYMHGSNYAPSQGLIISSPIPPLGTSKGRQQT